MTFETLFLVLFAIATAVAVAARWLKLPYTVALVLTGLALGMIQAIEAPHLTRHLLYAFILPGLLFEASFHLDLKELRRNGLAIPMLAVPGVLASILLTAGILTVFSRSLGFMKGFNFAQGFVFGAVVAATDPIAVVSLFGTLGAPTRLRVLVEGEQLENVGSCRHILRCQEPMEARDPVPAVEVVAACPGCGVVYAEAARMGRVRVAMNTECPECGTPTDPDPKDRGCDPPGTT